MSVTSDSWINAADSADPAAPERDRILTANGWGPLADNDDDGGDHTTEVEPDL